MDGETLARAGVVDDALRLIERIAEDEAQHRSFLEQVTGPTRALYLEWFKTLPLWLDLGGIRIIHACWHQPSVELVGRELGSNRFNSMGQFIRASDKSDPLYTAVDALLKGPEISLVDHGQAKFVDKDGHARSSVSTGPNTRHALTSVP